MKIPLNNILRGLVQHITTSGSGNKENVNLLVFSQHSGYFFEKLPLNGD